MKAETLDAIQELARALRLLAGALTKETALHLDYVAIIDAAAKRLGDAIQQEDVMTPPNPTDASKRAREMAEKFRYLYADWCSQHANINLYHSEAIEIDKSVQSELIPLLERINELEGALKPFVKFFTAYEEAKNRGMSQGFECMTVIFGGETLSTVTIHEFRHAAKVLEKGKGK